MTLRAKSVVLAPGARWRQTGVPGENDYRNKGVTYCPHCDGPLFKGKRVAVIGGGNSGVEAAIDLAGIVAQVTLIEFDGKLRADEVLQRKLHSLPNVRVITSAQTTEVLGDGGKVTGLVYKDRVDPGGGVMFIGSKGKLMHETYGYRPRLLPDALHASYGTPKPTLTRIQTTHEMNWVEAAKGTTQASCPFEYAARLVEVMLLGVVSLRARTKIHYDAANMRITNSAYANDFLRREYRTGWKLSTV